MIRRALRLSLVLAAVLLAASPALAQFPPSRAQMQRAQEAAQRAAAERGMVAAAGRTAREELARMRTLTAALGALKPQRPGVVDAYVLSVGLDADPVFGREAAEAGRVLARRYDAEGRTLTLAAGSGANDPAVPDGNPVAFAAALARIGEVMDPNEDVLVLYTTTHGHYITGLAYKDGERARGDIAPLRLKALLDDAGIRNRFLIISACFSGVFVPVLADERTLIMTAAAANKPSFGCRAENDWTFFGDALINNALRAPKPAPDAFADANGLISAWEARERLDPSLPQISIGAGVLSGWLRALDAKVPRTAGTPRGQPAAGPPAGTTR